MPEPISVKTSSQKSDDAVFCGRCGTKNPCSNTYCRSCGSPLSDPFADETEVCSKEGAVSEPVDLIQEKAKPESKNDPVAESAIEEKSSEVEGKDYVKVPINKDEAMSYRIPTIIFGMILGISVILAIVYVKIPFVVSGASTGIPISTEEYSLLDLAMEGYSSLLALMLVVIVFLALASFYSPTFGALAMALFMILMFCSPLLLQDVPEDYIRVTLRPTEDSYSIIYGTMFVLFIPGIISGYCLYKFSKQYPEKGDFYVSSKLWKP